VVLVELSERENRVARELTGRWSVASVVMATVNMSLTLDSSDDEASTVMVLGSCNVMMCHCEVT
jgi:hypothetical protein